MYVTHNRFSTLTKRYRTGTGTSDLTAFLTVPDGKRSRTFAHLLRYYHTDPRPLCSPAIAFRNWLGGEKAINDYCRQLALDGGARLAELLGTQLMDPNGELTLSMVRPFSPPVHPPPSPTLNVPSFFICAAPNRTAQTNVRLPLPIESSPGALYTPALRAQIDTLFRKKLLLEWNAYGAHYFHAGAWWTRCSAQVFNEVRRSIPRCRALWRWRALGSRLGAGRREVRG